MRAGVGVISGPGSLARAEAVGVSCEILLGHGEEPYLEIVDQAETSSMDVIVMGRHENSDLARLMLGSTTAKVIGHTHSDVLVVPEAATLSGKGIILPVDGSRYSDAAAVTALNLSKHCDVPVTVMSVAVTDDARDEAWALVGKVQSLMAESGVKVAVEVRVGRPDESIAACARERDADLIVMGSHGRTALERLLIGSVSERVIGSVECAVMVVKL